MSNSETTITLAHKIEILPNNKQKTHFRKAFGCARLAYNWALSRWKENYVQGIKMSCLDLKKEFNAIKRQQFPFVYEVTKYATQQPFICFQLAVQKFFKDLNKGVVSYPRYKKKRDNYGSFYIGGDQVVLSFDNKNSKAFKTLHNHTKAQYLKVPNLGYVKMTEHLRFQGKINSVTIRQEGDKFFACFSVTVPNTYLQTYPRSDLGLGIDVGIKSMVSLSNGLEVKAPKPLAKLSRKLVRKSRQLSKKQSPKTKGDKTPISTNHKKAKLKVSKLHRHIANIRKDFLQKLTSVIVKHVGYLCVEALNVKGMMANRKLAKAVADVSFFEFKRQLDYKCAWHYREIYQVGRFYPSSKTCSRCGHIKQDLTLADRVYHCEQCSLVLDRDYNASLNLSHYLHQQIGQVLPEFTPADLTAMWDDLATNRLATSKVETGI